MIIDLYGDKGRFALLTGRLKYLKRHFQMVLARIGQKRFTGGVVANENNLAIHIEKVSYRAHLA